MAWTIEDSEIVSAAMMPQVRDAAVSGVRLIGLWPLTDERMLSNDARYGETLQVRVTRVMASAMSGVEVSMADSEFVYEGATSIPGRSDAVADALLAANESYDAMSTYSQSGNIAVVMRGAAVAGAQWDDDAVKAIAAALDAIEVVARDPSREQPRQASGLESLAQRLGLVAAAVNGLLGILGQSSVRGGGTALSVRGVAPLLPYVNELCERMAIGRVFMDASDLEALVSARALCDNGDGDAGDVVGLFAAYAAREWDRHHDDVLWDPDEAERLAKEDDEKRRRAELNDRFSAERPASESSTSENARRNSL